MRVALLAATCRIYYIAYRPSNIEHLLDYLGLKTMTLFIRHSAGYVMLKAVAYKSEIEIQFENSIIEFWYAFLYITARWQGTSVLQ